MTDEVPKRILKSASMTAPELYALRASGYEPIGICIGVSAISMGTKGFGRTIRAIFQRGEMTTLSQTSAEARRTALARAEEEARKLDADLFLVSAWNDRDVAEIVEITVTGTAFRKCGEFTPMNMATATS